MNIPSSIHLDRLESESALWKKLREHIQGRLDMARKQNDYSMTNEETERLRGRIAAYKDILELEPGTILPMP